MTDCYSLDCYERLRADKSAGRLPNCAFTLPEMVARGELRPLRDPGATGIDDA